MVHKESLLKNAGYKKSRITGKKIKLQEKLISKLKKREGIQEAIDIINVCGNIQNSNNIDILKKRAVVKFLKCSGYNNENVFLGAGSYGEVFLVNKDKHLFAVKMVLIKEEISFLDEIKISLLFSKENIGPKVNGFYRVDIYNELMGIGFIVMEKMDQTLSNYLIDNKLSKNEEEMLFNILSKSIKMGIICTDIKPSNIMIKKDESNKIQFRLIDFGEFCCDIYPEYNEETVLDILLLLFAFTINLYTTKSVFKERFKKILSNKKRFALLIKAIYGPSRKCNIIDIYSNYQIKESFSKKIQRQINHYAIRYFISIYKLKKGVSYLKGKKPYYLNNYFGTVKSNKPIKDKDISKQFRLESWSVKVLVVLIFILNGKQKFYSKILPPNLFQKLVMNNKYIMYDKTRFYTIKNKKRKVLLKKKEEQKKVKSIKRKLRYYKKHGKLQRKTIRKKKIK